RGTSPWSVIGLDDRPVRQRGRRDVALPEAVGDGLLGQVLRANAELVLLLPANAAQPGDVLRGLAHRDVDVGDVAVLARVVPDGGAAVRQVSGPLLGLGEDGVLRVGSTVAAPLAEPADALDSSGQEDVALARLNRVVGHSGRLQRGGAVTRD